MQEFLRAEKALKIFLKKLKKMLDKMPGLCYYNIRKREAGGSVSAGN